MSYESEVLADFPAGFWKMEDTSGTTMRDSSGNSRDGTYYNGPTLDALRLYSNLTRSVQYHAGSNQYALVSYSSWMNTSDITCEALVHLTSVSTANLLDRDNGSSRSMQFRVYGGKLQFIWWTLGGSGAYTATGSTTLVTNVSYHLAATYDSATGTAKVYVDGVLDGTASSGALPLQSGSAPLNVARSGWGGFNVNGRGSHFAYYPSALSASRIAAHFAALTAPLPGDVILFDWKATGWRYYQFSSGSPPAGWETPSFDDTGWSVGQGSFGSGSGCPIQVHVNTTWSINSTLLMRRTYTLTDPANVYIDGSVDNDCEIFLNGVSLGTVTHDNCPSFGDIFVTAYAPAGTATFAFRSVDRGIESFSDWRATALYGSNPVASPKGWHVGRVVW